MPSNKSSLAIKATVAGSIPVISKFMTSFPQQGYIFLAIAFFLLAILVALYVKIYGKKEGSLVEQYEWALDLCVISLTCVLCILFFPSINATESAPESFHHQVEVLEEKKKAAASDDVDAMIWLGSFYSAMDSRQSHAPMMNYLEAGNYFEMAAASGSPVGYYKLAFLSYHGLGRIASRERAIDELKHSYEMGMDKRAMYDALKRIEITENEFPEGFNLVHEVLSRSEKRMDNIKQESDELIARAKEILTEFNRLREPIIDSIKITRFCQEKQDELVSLSERVQGVEDYLALFYLYLNDHDKGYDYASKGDKSGWVYRMYFSERQVFSEYQEKIDSVLSYCDRTTLAELYSRRDEFNLDPFYVIALRYELDKRERSLQEEDYKAQRHSIDKDFQRQIDKYLDNSILYELDPEEPKMHLRIAPSYVSGSYLSTFSKTIVEKIVRDDSFQFPYRLEY